MLAALALTAACALHADVAMPQDRLRLDTQLEVLRPAAGENLGLQDLLGEPACQRFVSSSGTTNFGGAAGSAWLRFRADLSAAPAGQWRLLIGFGGLDQVCVHWPLRDGSHSSDCADRRRSAEEAGRWRGGRLLFQVPADYAPRAPVHVQASAAYWLKLPLELATADALLADDREFGWGYYHGLLLAFALIGLAFYFGARDSALLFCSLHVATLALALLVWHGALSRLDPAGAWLPQLLFSLAGVFVATGSRFYQIFLRTTVYAPRAHRLLNACLALGLALAALAWLWPTFLPRLLGALVLLWVVAVSWPSYLRARQGYAPARALLAAVLVLLLGLLFAAASAIGLPLLSAESAQHVLQLGALTAALLLSAGMTLRLRDLIAERDQARDLAEANHRLALHRLQHDEITGLPRSAKFREDLQERLKLARRQAHKLALVSLSLDNFRVLGHALRQEDLDEALTETVLRLREQLTAGEMLASAGTDKFLWLTTQGDAADNHAELRKRCAQLRSVLGAPLARAAGASLQVSMGISLYPQHAETAEALARSSDEALHRTQQAHGGGVELFQSTMTGSSQRNLELSKDLQQALLRDELDLYFQPVVPLDGSGLFGAEALLRWNYKGKIITPDLFVPAAEASGLIIPLSDWVLRRAGRQIAEWRRRKLPVLTISVNISAQEFRSEGFAARVESALAETSAPGSGLVLELTEGMLVDDLDGAARILNHLAARGIKAAVDDFGVGYSSLSYLRTLPVQGIKIDRSFLKGVPDEADAVAVINAIITMGRELGLKITAEGIETNEQMKHLQERGVAGGQGWLFAKAMPARDFEAWLQQNRGH